jgi:hypothetical protein
MVNSPRSQTKLIQPIDVQAPASSMKFAILVLFLLEKGIAAILAVQPSAADSIQLKFDQQETI